VKRYLADSNVALDLATVDPVWLTWSQDQLRLAAATGEVLINPVIYAEIAPAFRTEAELAEWFRRTEMRKGPLPYAAAWPAAQAFARYRKAGGTRISLLPDFYIGAHAEVEGLTLITRDAARFRTYFPSVTLIAPA
jgi:predicted nucleic acid-binding protein